MAAACLLAVLPALAGQASLPVTHGELIRDNARITFEWPKPVHFQARADGKTLTITFERNANPNFGPLLSQLYPYITSARREHDGKTIVFTLDEPYKIRTFITDNVSGVDLLSIDPAKRQALMQPARPSPSLNALAPAATGGKPPTIGAASATPPAPAATTSAAPPANDSAALPPATVPSTNTPPPASAQAAPNGPIRVAISAGDDNAVLRFPFNERVALAAFIRAGTLWVVFNKPVQFDLSEFNNMPKTVIGKAEVLSSPGAAILRIPVDNRVFLSTAQEDGKLSWAVLLTAKSRTLANELKIDVNTEPPVPPNVFIASLETAEPLSVHDPLLGDDMIVVPLFNPGEGVGVRRDFIEFSLLETAQGIAVVKKADDVAVSELRNGLRIDLPGGATLSPNLPEVESMQQSEALQNVATLFSYDQWKLQKPETWHAQYRELFHRIVESPNISDSDQARLRIAQVYLSEGLAPESLAFLDGIERTDPVFYRGAKLAAMHGAANFLMYRFSEAAQDFSARELNNNKEVDYWRNMLSDLLGGTGQYDYLAMNPDYISKYPPLFRQRLAIVAADRSVDSKEYNTALKIFDTLHQDKLLDPINPYVNYLLAKIASDTGQEDDATAMWDKLADDYEHPFVQARAEFSRIVWGMDHGTLDKDQIIDRLEKLRLSWHGDSLELKVLGMLGDLYSEKKDYVNAMRVWNDAVTGFPNTTAVASMFHKMEDTFTLMFSQGGADSLPPLQALALYYQYHNFAPPGTIGNDMIDRLADRLVSVDLLDQAASLLDHQMHFQSEKEARSRIGVKLATVDLLDHEPKRALTALEDSVYGENPLLLRLLRNRLTAQAMADLGQDDKALQVLGQDSSLDAARVRLSVYWQEKDWPHVISCVEGMLKARKDVTAPITIDESEDLLKLALAYVFENNPVQLQYLHDYFDPLMVNNPNKAMFDFITARDITPTPTNFDEIINRLSATRSFLDNYSARIKLGGLKQVTDNNRQDTSGSAKTSNN